MTGMTGDADRIAEKDTPREALIEALARVRRLADLYDECGRARTPRPPWSHTATEIRNAARVAPQPRP